MKMMNAIIKPGGKIICSDFHPFTKIYDEMCDDEKAEIRKYSENMGLEYEFIKFSRFSIN
jgi:hypothetical protein